MSRKTPWEPPKSERGTFLSAMQRALLAAVADGRLYVFTATATGRMTEVRQGTVLDGPKLRPLGIRLAMDNGWIVLGEAKSQTNAGTWSQLLLAPDGRAALDHAKARKEQR